MSTGSIGGRSGVFPRKLDEPGMASAVSRGRILVADDGSHLRKILPRVLQRLGYEVGVAENGRVASQMALSAMEQGEPFDLILMDIEMPEIDGCEAAALLRASGYPGRIVALTGCTEDGIRQKCLDAGCNDYASKPISFDTLLDVLKQNLPIARHQGRNSETSSVPVSIKMSA